MDRHPEIPFHRPSIGQAEIEEVVRTLKSGWLTSGPRTEQFEVEFREYVQVPHSLAVNSCTAGLHLALAALELGPGAEVITTPLTFCATVNVILHTGATPVLADVDADGNIDPASVAERITDRTRAILPVHLAGLPVEMDEIWRLARKHRLHVVEDAAHAVGARYRNWQIGAGNPDTGDCSAATAYSFYATKNLTTGEGGMVVTHDEQIASTMRMLCLHGINRDAWNRYRDRGKWYYNVAEPGFKYNLSDLQSAIGIHQLRKLEQFTEARAKYAAIYNEILGDVDEFELPSEKPHCRHAWHLYMLRLNLEELTINRGEFIEALADRGIGASVHFIPIPLHPFFAPYALLPQNQVPNALAMYPRLVSLPLFPGMSEAEVEYVARTAADIARQARRRHAVAVQEQYAS
jgi:dTDP-4-amino-4,6-dideoxygalactose transaminase